MSDSDAPLAKLARAYAERLDIAVNLGESDILAADLALIGPKYAAALKSLGLTRDGKVAAPPVAPARFDASGF
jgi:hypothetical protein